MVILNEEHLAAQNPAWVERTLERICPVARFDWATVSGIAPLVLFVDPLASESETRTAIVNQLLIDRLAGKLKLH